jgi:acyl-coenzyme A thioesterase PaaI-like protein
MMRDNGAAGKRAEKVELADELVVLGMSANPKPQHAVGGIHGHSSMMKADSSRPITADLLEMERRVPRVNA